MPVEPISIAAAINTSINIFEITYQLKAVDEQTADLISTTRHVMLNIKEARRLRRLKDALLKVEERTWMDSIINDTENALRAVSQLIEPARVDTNTRQSINLGNRIMWVFRDSPKVRDKHARLSVCHQSLTSVISCLYSKDVVVCAPAPKEVNEDEPPPYDPAMESLLNWRNQRRRRKSSAILGHGAVGSPIASTENLENAVTPIDASGLKDTLADVTSELPTFNSKDESPLSAGIRPRSNDSNESFSDTKIDVYTGARSSKTTYVDGELDPHETSSSAGISMHSATSTRPFATMAAIPRSYSDSEGLQVDERYKPCHQSFPRGLPSHTPSQTNIIGSILSSTSPIHTAQGTMPESAGQHPAHRQAEIPRPAEHLCDPSPSTPIPKATQPRTLPSRTYSDSASEGLVMPKPPAERGNAAPEPDKPLSVGRGGKRRGRRSWLAFHATRSDIGHSTG